jgi:Resolvase, N terminal domain
MSRRKQAPSPPAQNSGARRLALYMRVSTGYARFSSDRQRDRSIDDQVALCQALADRNSWAVAMIYADFAASGSTVHRLAPPGRG